MISDWFNNPKKIRLTNNLVLVKRVPYPEKIGGLFRTTPEDEHYSCVGTVVAVGEGKRLKNGKRKPILVKVGDFVMWRVLHDRGLWRDYALLEAEDIIGKDAEEFKPTKKHPTPADV